MPAAQVPKQTNMDITKVGKKMKRWPSPGLSYSLPLTADNPTSCTTLAALAARLVVDSDPVLLGQLLGCSRALSNSFVVQLR